MSYKENLRERRAVTNECYLCFNNLVKPRKCYDKEKYSTLIAFPSTDESTHAKIIAAMRAAFEQAREKLCENGAELRFEDALTPLKKDCENFDGMYLMNVMTTEKPRLVDSQLKNLKLKTEPAFGSTGRVAVLFCCTKIDGQARIYGVLQNTMIISNKNHLENTVEFSAEEDFGEFLARENS